MKDSKDTATVELPLEGSQRRRGRPKGATPPLTPAEKQKRYRERLKAAREARPVASVSLEREHALTLVRLLEREGERLERARASGSPYADAMLVGYSELLERVLPACAEAFGWPAGMDGLPLLAEYRLLARAAADAARVRGT